MKKYTIPLKFSLFVSLISIFILIPSDSFAKPPTQATCGLGSGGGTLGTNFKYQVISNYLPLRAHVVSQKTKNASGEFLQQYERVINFELTSFPMPQDNKGVPLGSQFAIISIEDSNGND